MSSKLLIIALAATGLSLKSHYDSDLIFTTKHKKQSRVTTPAKRTQEEVQSIASIICQRTGLRKDDLLARTPDGFVSIENGRSAKGITIEQAIISAAEQGYQVNAKSKVYDFLNVLPYASGGDKPLALDEDDSWIRLIHQRVVTLPNGKEIVVKNSDTFKRTENLPFVYKLVLQYINGRNETEPNIS